jgi:hypothetical protein
VIRLEERAWAIYLQKVGGLAASNSTYLDLKLARRSFELAIEFEKAEKEYKEERYETRPPIIITREKIIGAWDVATYKEFDLNKIRDKLIKELGL